MGRWRTCALLPTMLEPIYTLRSDHLVAQFALLRLLLTYAISLRPSVSKWNFVYITITRVEKIAHQRRLSDSCLIYVPILYPKYCKTFYWYIWKKLHRALLTLKSRYLSCGDMRLFMIRCAYSFRLIQAKTYYMLLTFLCLRCNHASVCGASTCQLWLFASPVL